MRELDIENWNRKEHFHFFNQFVDPYFAVTVDFDVTEVYKYAQKSTISFCSDDCIDFYGARPAS